MIFPYLSKEFKAQKVEQPGLSRFAYYLKGPYGKLTISVKSIFSESQVSVDKDYYSKQTFVFDTSNKIIQIKTVDRSSNEKVTNFRYDEEEGVTFKDDKVFGHYSCDKEAKIVATFYDDTANRSEKVYDTENRLVKSNSFLKGELISYDTFEHDEENRIIKWLEYDIPSDEFGNDTNEEIQLVSEKRLSYTKHFGNKVKCLFTDFDLIDNMTFKEVYIINPDLTVDCHQYLNKKGSVVHEQKFKYIYGIHDLIEIEETTVFYTDNPKGRVTGVKQIKFEYE